MTSKTFLLAVPGLSHSLEARLARADQTRELAVVAPPHPLYGGSIGNPVVRALESVFQARGLATRWRSTSAASARARASRAAKPRTRWSIPSRRRAVQVI